MLVFTFDNFLSLLVHRQGCVKQFFSAHIPVDPPNDAALSQQQCLLLESICGPFRPNNCEDLQPRYVQHDAHLIDKIDCYRIPPSKSWNEKKQWWEEQRRQSRETNELAENSGFANPWHYKRYIVTSPPNNSAPSLLKDPKLLPLFLSLGSLSTKSGVQDGKPLLLPNTLPLPYWIKILKK